MAKQQGQEGFNVVEEARLRAEHNANPYYWLSRLPRAGPMRRRFNRGASIVIGLVSLVIIGLTSWTLPGVVRNGQVGQIVAWSILLGGALAMEAAVILT